MRTEAGKPMETSVENMIQAATSSASTSTGAPTHPSDDIMTELLNVEFEDETGTVRRLTRDELLTYVSVVSGAGNETTTRLIGWAGKVLAEHPDQRRALVEDPSLIPAAVEELLRLRAAGSARRALRHPRLEYHGQTGARGQRHDDADRGGQP